MPDVTRVVYELGGDKHTFWSRTDDVTHRPDGRMVAINIETGQQKVLYPHTPVALTHGAELPPKVDDAEVLTDG